MLLTFNVMSIVTLILLTLPVIGFWLIFAASRSPRLPEKILPALTLFKVRIIIDLVMACLVILVLLIAVLALLIGASVTSGYPSYYYNGSGALMIIGIVLLIVTCGATVYMIIYYRSLLGTLRGIRNGITLNWFNPLRGVKTFSVLTYINVGFTAIGAITTAFTSSLINNRLYYDLIYDLPRELRQIIEPFLSTLRNSVYSAVFNLIASAGIIICVIVLNRVSNSLSSGYYQPYRTNGPM